MSLATTAIITKGLTGGLGGTICQKGIITSAFSLYYTEGVAPPEPGPGGGGAAIGSWANVPDRIMVPPTKRTEQEKKQEQKVVEKQRVITVKVNLGPIHVERNYVVETEKPNIIIKVLSVYSASKEAMVRMVKRVPYASVIGGTITQYTIKAKGLSRLTVKSTMISIATPVIKRIKSTFKSDK